MEDTDAYMHICTYVYTIMLHYFHFDCSILPLIYKHIQWTLIYPDFTYPVARIIQTPNIPGIVHLHVSFLALVVYNNRCTCVLSQQKMATPIVKRKRIDLFLLSLLYIANM